MCVCASVNECVFCMCVYARARARFYLPPSGPCLERFSVKITVTPWQDYHCEKQHLEETRCSCSFSLRCSKKFLASQLEAQDLFLTYMGVLGLVFPSKKQKKEQRTHLKFTLSYIQQGYSISALQ